MPKGSFYYAVPSKQALALAVVDEHWVGQRDQWVNILTDPAPIVERLNRLFVLTAEMQRSPGAWRSGPTSSTWSTRWAVCPDALLTNIRLYGNEVVPQVRELLASQASKTVSAVG